MAEKHILLILFRCPQRSLSMIWIIRSKIIIGFKQWGGNFFSHIMYNTKKIYHKTLWVEQCLTGIFIVVQQQRLVVLLDTTPFLRVSHHAIFLRLMITISLYHSITVNNEVAKVLSTSNFIFWTKFTTLNYFQH